MLLVGADASMSVAVQLLQGTADAACLLTFSVAVHHAVLISAWPALHENDDGCGLRQSITICAVGAV